MTDPAGLFALAAVTFVAATLHGTAGFGFGLIAMPAYAWLTGSLDAVPLVMVVNLTLSLVLAVRLRELIRWPMVGRFGLGALLGLPPGLYAFSRAEISDLMIGVGIAVIAFAVIVSVRRPPAPGQGDPEAGWLGAGGAGGVSGAMTVALGMPGPPIILYLTGIGVAKDAARATALCFFCAAYVASLSLQAATVGVSREVLPTGALLLPAAVLGGMAGNRLARSVNEAVFRRGVLVLLMLVGVSALFSGLRG